MLGKQLNGMESTTYMYKDPTINGIPSTAKWPNVALETLSLHQGAGTSYSSLEFIVFLENLLVILIQR